MKLELKLEDKNFSTKEKVKPKTIKTLLKLRLKSLFKKTLTEKD
ncbi:hypothetical protein KAOT1_12892 [Kordia algicida OT-1]|uniref:Uncharacterized protein n=1 Tax=Kordia algicida OT-1 TaxID=391587 RepID=A9DJJ4_9FLAO|nr:hypothetical protein KAOT1_12892 [Kordia algicida OT-1]